MFKSKKLTDFKGSSKFQVKMQKLLTSFLNSFHSIPLGSPIHIQIISSMKRNTRGRCFPCRCILLPISCTAKYSVSHMQATEVPVVVPDSWRKYKSPHSNISFVITNDVASLTASKWKLSGRLRLSSQIPITSRACSVLMSVYSESVSIAKR